MLTMLASIGSQARSGRSLPPDNGVLIAVGRGIGIDQLPTLPAERLSGEEIFPRKGVWLLGWRRRHHFAERMRTLGMSHATPPHSKRRH